MQPKPQTRDLEMDKQMLIEVIEKMVELIKENYIFPEVALEIETTLIRKMSENEFDHIKSASVFCETITSHLQQISKDKHLGLRYSFEQMKPDQAYIEKAEEERKERLSLTNFGFEKAERLPGNIGYLKTLNFFEADLAGDVAIGAMNFLANTSAMIFDLRDNTGGTSEMVALLSSYFFEERVHLNSFYWREGNRTEQIWTLPYVPGKKYLNKQVYMLTSKRTFSGAEDISYTFKNLKRAIIVGERTKGGAHPGGPIQVNEHFTVNIPVGRAINPITGDNWEGVGVIPHIEVPEEHALLVAQVEILKHLYTTEQNETPIKNVWKNRLEELTEELGEAANYTIKDL